MTSEIFFTHNAMITGERSEVLVDLLVMCGKEKLMDLPVNYDELHYTERKKVREEYIKLQDGKCCHCGAPLNETPEKSIACKPINKRLFPPNFFKWPIHLHHSHDTGMTIGAVHCHCNAVLWQYHGE